MTLRADAKARQLTNALSPFFVVAAATTVLLAVVGVIVALV